MSYTTAQALLEDLLGGNKDATALETYLGTAANKGTFDYLLRDADLSAALVDDPTAFTAVRDSALARTALINCEKAMIVAASSRLAMGLMADSSTFMNDLVTVGRGIKAFVRSAYLRAVITGTRKTTFDTAAALGGSKLKRQSFTTAGTATWTRPGTLLWMYVLAIAAGGGGFFSSTIGAGGSGMARGVILEDEKLPNANVTVTVPAAQAGNSSNDGGPASFGSHVTSMGGNRGSEYHQGLGRTIPRWTPSQFGKGDVPTLLFDTSEANSRIQDREFCLWGLDGSTFHAAHSPLGTRVVAGDLLGTGAVGNSAAAVGFGGGATVNSAGSPNYNGGPGVVVVYWIEE